MSEPTDKSQDWPLRDYSERCGRPGTDEPAFDEPELPPPGVRAGDPLRRGRARGGPEAPSRSRRAAARGERCRPEEPESAGRGAGEPGRGAAGASGGACGRRLPRAGRPPGAGGRAGRHPPRGRRRRQPLQRRDHEPPARERARRARRGRRRTRRDSRRPRARRVRAPARGDGAREDAPLLVRGRARRGDPRRDAALRLRRRRGGERASAGGNRDGRAGLVRPPHLRHGGAGRGAGRDAAPGRRGPRSRWPTCSRSCARARR